MPYALKLRKMVIFFFNVGVGLERFKRLVFAYFISTVQIISPVHIFSPIHVDVVGFTFHGSQYHTIIYFTLLNKLI